jgi:hypothetical protein
VIGDYGMGDWPAGHDYLLQEVSVMSLLSHPATEAFTSESRELNEVVL